MTKRKLLAVWTVAFCGLFLFTGTAIGALTDWGKTRAYAQTIESHKDFKNFRNFVEVDGEGIKDPGILKRFGGEGEAKMICSVTPLQAAELDAFFHVKEFDINIGGNIVTIEKVSGRTLTAKQLKDFLRASDESLQCHLIGRGHVFFLPLIPHIS